MVEIIFEFNQIYTNIICNDTNVKFEQILQHLKTEIEIDISKYIFVYERKEIKENLTIDELLNIEDKNRKKMNILAYKRAKDDINNNDYSFFSKIKQIEDLVASNISTIKEDIKELDKNKDIIKALKNEIILIKNELKELKDKNNLINNFQDLNEKININNSKNNFLLNEIEKNKNINNDLLNNIKENNNINNDLLNNIKENNNINNKLITEIEINKSIQRELNNYIDKLTNFKDEIRENLTANNSLKLQNYRIGNSANCIVKTQDNGKIFPNLIFTKGMIISWFGQINEVPQGWAICDGKKGTPDLRNRFIIGVSEQIKLGSEGGDSHVILSKSNLPPLGTGYFSAESHRGHWHHSTNGFIKYQGWYASYVKSSDNGDDWGSNWKIDLDEGMNSSPINILNPYFALFYIMKL